MPSPDQEVKERVRTYIVYVCPECGERVDVESTKNPSLGQSWDCEHGDYWVEDENEPYGGHYEMTKPRRIETVALEEPTP